MSSFHLQIVTPDGSFFAFEDAQARFSSVEPLSLLPGQTPQIHAAEAANPCDARCGPKASIFPSAYTL